jgi:hypothetical protein
MIKSLSRTAPASTRACRRDPDKAPAWANVLAIASLAFLAFVAGAAIMYFGVFPMDPLRRAFAGGAALYEGMTQYNDRIPIIFWVQRIDPERYFNPDFKAQLVDSVQ